MGNINDLSDLINRSSGGSSGNPQTVFFHKTNRIGGGAADATIAGRAHSLWLYEGYPTSGPTPPVGSFVNTNQTTGSLFFNNPSNNNESHLIQFFTTSTFGGTLLLYDRLYVDGGLTGNSTAVQDTSGVITRNVTGIGNIAFLEINTTIGTTATTVRMVYQNESGLTRTGALVAIGGTNNRERTRAILLPTATGFNDKGIKNVLSISLTASTTTAGNMSLVLAKPIAYVAVATAGAPGGRDFVVGLPGIPKIEPSSCLSLLWFANSTSSSDYFGGYSIVEA